MQPALPCNTPKEDTTEQEKHDSAASGSQTEESPGNAPKVLPEDNNSSQEASEPSHSQNPETSPEPSPKRARLNKGLSESIVLSSSVDISRDEDEFSLYEPKSPESESQSEGEITFSGELEHVTEHIRTNEE